jgi:hypothetical protein
VSFRDQAHDRETEAGTGTVAARVRQREALEGAAEEGRWEARSLVLDVELDGAVHGLSADDDAAAPVAERVVDEVPERLLEP